MATIASVEQTGVGTSGWIPLNHLQPDFKVSLFVEVTGTVTYTVQHTPDNVLATGVSATAFDHDYLNGFTVSDDGNYAYPIRGVRINVTAGTGTATLKVLQGD